MLRFETIVPTLGDLTSHASRHCPACGQSDPAEHARRFGGRLVCAECWQGLSRLERSWAFRGLPRASLLAHFAAEVAVRRLPHRDVQRA